MRILRATLARLFRCHPATWLAVLASTLVTVLLVVPGEGCSRLYDHTDSWWKQQCQAVQDETQSQIVTLRTTGEANGLFLQPVLWEHGWPMPWLVRSQPGNVMGGYYKMRSEPWLVLGRRRENCNGAVMESVSWSNYDNWPLASMTWRIHPLGVLVNAASLLAVVGLVGWGAERWLRNPGGLLRFRLIDVLLAVTAVGMLLAWYRYDRYQSAIEQAVAAHFANAPEHEGRWYTSYEKYVGPVWLRKLIGDDAYVPWFHHVQTVNYSSGMSWEEDVRQLIRLPHVEEINCNHGLPHSAIGLLAESHRLERLTLSAEGHGNWKAIEHHGGGLTSIDWLRPEQLAALAPLELEQLRLGGQNVLAEDVERLLEATPIKRLELSYCSITPSEFSSLQQQFPDTEMQLRWAGNNKSQPPADLADRIEAELTARTER